MRRRSAFVLASLFGFLFSWGATSPVFAAHGNPTAHPFATIPVAPLGYHPIGPVYKLLHLSSLSLDFIDNTHLLFTFHYSRLMSREVEPGHDDQIIRAVVLEVPSGKVGATAEWRMHDRQQYLFALGAGEFLVRRGGDIDRMGSDLLLHPYIHFPNHLEAVQISPDGQILTIESDLERHSAADHKRLVAEAIANGDNLPDEDIAVQMVSLDSRNVVGEARSGGPVRLAVASAGYVDHEQASGNNWKIILHPFKGSSTGKGKVLDQLISSCAPSEDFISTDVVMVSLCSVQSSDRSVTAVTTDGKQTWSGTWDGRFIGPNLSLSTEGRNFAISWLISSHAVDAMFSLSDEDVQGQAVEVLGTATGHMLLSVNASPVESAGQNFALSADGTRLAVLNKGQIEIYEVPADTAK